MAPPPRGFTLLQILVAVIIVGVLAGLGVVRYQRMQEERVIETLRSDLRAVATLQVAFAARYHDYAGGSIPSGTADTAAGGAGQVIFTPSPGNRVDITWRSSTGYAAVASNARTSTHCGVYVGEGGYAPNAAVTTPNSPACW